MINWAWAGNLSGLIDGARFWCEDSADNAVYEIEGGYSVRDMVFNDHLAGPFESFEAACAAYEVIKGG